MAWRDLHEKSVEKEEENRGTLTKQCDDIAAVLSQTRDFLRERLSDKEVSLIEIEKGVDAQKKARTELESRVKDELRSLMPMNMMRDLGQVESSRAHSAEEVFILCQTSITSQTETLKREEKNIETMSDRLKLTEAELKSEQERLNRLEQEIKQQVQNLNTRMMESTQRLKGELEQKKADVQHRLQELEESVERRNQSLQVRLDEKSREVAEVIQDMYRDARDAGIRV